MDTYEITVHSVMYGKTTCVVDIKTFLQGRKTFPCGDGTDYTLRRMEIVGIKAELRAKGVAS